MIKIRDLRLRLGPSEWERVWPKLGCPALGAKVSLGDLALVDRPPVSFAYFYCLDWSDLETRRAVLCLTVCLLRQRCVKARAVTRLLDELERWETTPMLDLYTRARRWQAKRLILDAPSVRVARAVGQAAVLTVSSSDIVTPRRLADFAVTYLHDHTSDQERQLAALLEVFPPLLTERWTNPWWERTES